MRGWTSGDGTDMGLAEFIRDITGVESVEVEEGLLLPGGAIQKNQALTVTIGDGNLEGTHEMVLRCEASAKLSESQPLKHQFKLLEIAQRATITVPRPYWFCGDSSVIGQPFFLMERIKGESLGNRITRNGPQPAIAAELGRELAKIHAIGNLGDQLNFLEAIKVSPALDAITKYRRYLDELPEPHPVIEWTLRWLERKAPTSDEIVLCHRDFRTGNYMVHSKRLTGILDWEFAGWGDPHEDIAWFCARCWRFSAPEQKAGGIADRQSFYNAYEKHSGRSIDHQQINYWETMAHTRWAIIALQQSMRHRSKEEPNLELALIGRRLAELEYECLKLTGVL